MGARSRRLQPPHVGIGKRPAILDATETTTLSGVSNQPRARGDVALSVKAAGRGTALDRFRQSGSLKCLFPRASASDGGPMQAVLVNTAGGITGGDRFGVTATAGTGTALTLTTQAAERAYAAQPGAEGRLVTRLAAGPGARLNWLPQETLLFNDSALRRRITVDLDDSAEFLLAEPLVFGRLAMGETVTRATFDDRIEILQGGRPLFLDATRLAGDIDARLAQPAIAGGARAMALVVFVSRSAAAHVSALRAMLPPTGGASLVGEDVLAVRLLASDSFELRRSLLPCLARLTDNTLPRCWTI